MRKLFLYCTLSVLLLASPDLSWAQVPDLGSAGRFVLFTTTGAVGNTGLSTLTGEIGTNVGAITGFSSTDDGDMHIADSVTLQASADLQSAYDYLNTVTPTSAHAPALGGGETLFAGVYSMAGAGSAASDLYLDAQGNSCAVFIFQIGGAFTTGASTTVHLVNGAQAGNVFWKVDGAVSMAAGTSMVGTIIAYGAVGIGAGGSIDGRMLSTAGAISVYGVEADTPIGGCDIILPVDLISFTAFCEGPNKLLQWSTASEVNNNYFTVERSADASHWQAIKIVPGAGNATTIQNYSLSDLSQLDQTEYSYYRLKQTDFDGQFKYSPIVSAANCVTENGAALLVYPNPTNGKLSLSFNSEADQVTSIEVFNILGEKVDGSMGFQSGFDLTAKPSGIYFVHIYMLSEIIVRKIVIER